MQHPAKTSAGHALDGRSGSSVATGTAGPGDAGSVGPRRATVRRLRKSVMAGNYEIDTHAVAAAVLASWKATDQSH